METDLINALKALGYKASEAKMRAQGAMSRLGAETALTALVKEALKPPPAPEVEEEVEEAPQKRQFPKLQRHSQKQPKFHWGYFFLVGWWVTLLVVLLRFVLMGIESVFQFETRRDPAVPALLGWW